MTESEWLVTTDVAAMLHAVQHALMPDGRIFHVSDRRLLAFTAEAGCAECAHRTRGMTADERALFVAGASCRTPAEKAALLRDIVGNPWRPVGPLWETFDYQYGGHTIASRQVKVPWLLGPAGDTVRRLAAACDPRQPAHLAALGDALWEGGLGEDNKADSQGPEILAGEECPYCTNWPANSPHGENGWVKCVRWKSEVPDDRYRKCRKCNRLWLPGYDTVALVRKVRDGAAVALLRHLAVEDGAPWGYERCPACLGTASKWPSIQPDIAPCTYCRGGWVPRALPHVPGCWAVDLLQGTP